MNHAVSKENASCQRLFAMSQESTTTHLLDFRLDPGLLEQASNQATNQGTDENATMCFIAFSSSWIW